MADVKFSVIVPVYNLEAYVGDCIDSLLKQIYKAYEIIIIDDGSSDSSRDICDRYEKKYSNVIVVHKKNGGVVSARKEGTKIARGDYIVCIDGDDTVDNEYLLYFKEIIEKYGADIVTCGYYKYNLSDIVSGTAGFEEGFYDSKRKEKELLTCLFADERGKSLPVSVWGKAIKRELFEKEIKEVDDSLNMGEDAACIIPCFYYAKSVYLGKDAHYIYRFRESQLTSSKKVYDMMNPLIRKKHYEKRIEINKEDYIDQLSRVTTKALTTAVISQFNRNDSQNEIKRSIKKALKMPEYSEAIDRCRYKGISMKRIETMMVKTKMPSMMKLLYLYKRTRDNHRRVVTK